MADHDDLRDPKPRKAPTKSVVDKVIDLALGAGGGAVSLFSGLLAAVLILYSGYVLYDTFDTQRQASSSAWDLLQYKPEIIDDYDTPLSSSALRDINQDYRAWLTVFDTSIDYPVVQGEDDLYYATHDIYQRSSLTGAIYLAAANSPDFSDSYNIIYGHHMDNGAMFGGLDNMTGNETGVLVTEDDIFDIQFFAVITTDAYEGRIYTAGDRMEDVLDFLRSGGEGGVGVGTEVLYFNEEAAEGAEMLVALSTCANAETSGRLVVIGRINRHVVKKSITVTKVWEDNDDQDGKRPDSIIVTASDGTSVELSAANNWTSTMSVPKFDKDGEIQYTWSESEVDGYTLVSNVTEENSTTLTNKHDPATTSLTVTMVWDDANNQDGLRPDSITVTLSNGTQVVLNAENGWSASISDLPVYSDGEPIVYTWTAETVDGYTLTNIAVDGTSTVLTNTHIPETEEPTVDLRVLKVVTGDAPARGYSTGDVIPYWITVVNNGNQTVHNIHAVDELTGDSWTIESLEPGAMQSFTASYTVTSADVISGKVENIATASGDPIEIPGNPDSPITPADEDSVMVYTAALDPSLVLTKTVTNGANGKVFGLGETIEYQIVVTNTGNVDYPNVVVTDDLTGMEETIPLLKVGESRIFTTSYVVTVEDILAGTVENTATAEGDEITNPATNNPETPYGEDDADVETEDIIASITVEKKVVNGDLFRVGDVITYEIVVINDGNVPYRNVVVTDDLTGMTETIPLLNPGESRTFTTSYTVTAEDLAAGYVENTADAIGDEIMPGSPLIPEGHGSTITNVSQAVVLTVNYWINGEQAATPFTATYNYGSTYNVTSPVLAGYSADYPVVSGVITADTVLNVNYIRNNYQLTIHYVDTNGNVVSAPYTASVAYGDTYTVPVPSIPGYTTQITTVTGTMPGRDEEITVFYIPNPRVTPTPAVPGQPTPTPTVPADTSIDIDEYRVPLGLGFVNLNEGDCIE